MELEIVAEEYMSIDICNGVETLPLLPNSLSLTHTVRLPVRPTSVCHYNGNTYVGLWDKSIARIDSGYKLHESFIILSASVASVTI